MLFYFIPVVLLGLATAIKTTGFPSTCPSIPPKSPNATLGVCPNDFSIIGGHLEAVHRSHQAPTGLAVDEDLNIYIAYPRNAGPTPNNVVIATGFDQEEPWPNAAIQNCTAGQNASLCFVNVQNPVLDSRGVIWVVDSGIPPGQQTAVDYRRGLRRLLRRAAHILVERQRQDPHHRRVRRHCTRLRKHLLGRTRVATFLLRLARNCC